MVNLHVSTEAKALIHANRQVYVEMSNKFTYFNYSELICSV